MGREVNALPYIYMDNCSLDSRNRLLMFFDIMPLRTSEALDGKIYERLTYLEKAFFACFI
jgi:hypothetical protein